MYDLAVIGAGWAGFNASLAAKSQGLKVALIDSGPIGGTCLNLGCIPTKALIQSAKIFSQVNKAKIFGIDISSSAAVDWGDILDRKDTIINQLRQGMESRLSGIDLFSSQAKIPASNTISLKDREIKSRFILIATGSEPKADKIIPTDKKKVIFSDEVFKLKEIPGNMLIIGGGAIGCEFASLFNLLGSKISVFELMPHLLIGEDEEVSRKLETIFKKRGISVKTSVKLKNEDLLAFDLVLICVGRKPRTSNLGLDKLGIKLEKERIVTDEFLKTSVSNIYAAGDCTSRLMLAHFAHYQGELAVHNMFTPSEPKRLSEENIPRCIFTYPEVAGIGLTEKDCRDKGMDIAIHKYDFLASGMARIMAETEGFVKIISDKASQRIIGAAIIGPKASELIGILTLAIQAKLKTSFFQDLIIAHPTLCESIREAFN